METEESYIYGYFMCLEAFNIYLRTKFICNNHAEPTQTLNYYY